MKKCPKCNTFTEETDAICDICGFVFNNNVSEQSHNNLNIVYLNNNVSNIPRCPICKSSEIHKISITETPTAKARWVLI